MVLARTLAFLFVFSLAARAEDADAATLAKIYKSVEALPQKVHGAAINAKMVLEADETWTPDNVYMVFGAFSVGTHTLTIQAGTVVMFNDDALVNGSPPHGSIGVEDGGAVIIKGTAEKHVILTSFDNPELFWHGILTGFNYKEINLEYVDFYKAGAGAGPGALATMHCDTAPAVRLSHVTFRKLQSKGVRIWNSTGITADSSMTFFDFTDRNTDPMYQYPVMNIDPVAAGTLTKENFIVKDGIPEHSREAFIDTPQVNKSVTWHELGVPWRIQEIQVPGDTFTGPPVTLTIEAGVVMKIMNIVTIGGKSGVGETDMGNIVAVGTKEKPIRFTSAEMKPKPGDWQSFFFRAGSFDPKVSRFDYVILEYGGSLPTNTMWHEWDNRGDVGSEVAIMNAPVSAPYDGPQITHTTFRKSGGQAVRARTMADYRLKQDYTEEKYGNTFEDFADPGQRQLPNTKKE